MVPPGKTQTLKGNDKKIKKDRLFLYLFYFIRLGCESRISFSCENGEFIFNEKLSKDFHNHSKDDTLKTKLCKSEIENFCKEEVLNSDTKPSDMQEKIKLKFGFDVDYKYSANMVYKVIKETFGEPTQDAHNLELLCQDIKKNFTEFYFKSQFDKENKLQSIFFSTPSMRKQDDKQCS